MSNSSNYAEVLTDFLRNKGIEVKIEKRNWIRFVGSNALAYVNASREYPNDNYGWYDFSKTTYDELVSDNTTYDTYCTILLGDPNVVFVLSKDDVKTIFDERFMNKPDEWMFNIFRENGEFVLKFTKKDTPLYPMGKFLNQWEMIINSKSTADRSLRPKIAEKQQHRYSTDQTTETDSLCNVLLSHIDPKEYLSSIDGGTIVRWTKALDPLRAKLSSESYEDWKTKLDTKTLTEIYEFIVQREGQLGEITNHQEIPQVHNLSSQSAVIMCGIRQLQYQFANTANMNAHKYTVLKNQFPNILNENPNYWIFVVIDEDVFQTRMEDKFWGLNKGTVLRTALKEGDRIIFCHGAKKFIGKATLASNQFELSEEEKQHYSHGKDSLMADYGVPLTEIEVWKEPKRVEDYLGSLSFVKRKEQYPAYFQGGIKRISNREYAVITGAEFTSDSYQSKSSSPLSFVKLQKFLLSGMKMQANYQPIMIRTLLLSGGRATKGTIATKISDLNPGRSHEDFVHIPVYDVLERNGIVKRHNNDEYILNSVDLTNEERHQLVALCNWRIENMPLQLEELIQAFDKNRSLFGPRRIPPEEAEKIRSAFVSDFAIEKIHLLELDQYVIGKPLSTTGEVNTSTFCYRLLYELGEVLSGFGVKSPLDFGIYYSQKNKMYKYKDEQKYATPQNAFDQIKSEIYSILEAGKQYNADHDINSLASKLSQDYILERRIISKLLSVYYPFDFVHIHSQKQIEDILEALGKPIYERENFFLSQSRLLEVKTSHSIMSQWNNNEFSDFVWNAIIQRKSKKTVKAESIDQYKDKSTASTFITGYTSENLKISKNQQLLGWVNNSNYLSEGSLVFVFNKDKLAFETCFRIKSKLVDEISDDKLIWADEIAKNKKIYGNRWKAEIVYDDLRISLEEINKISPFEKEPFQGLLRANFPMPLDSPTNSYKYKGLKEVLMQTINQPYSFKSDNEEPSNKQFEDAPLTVPPAEKIEEAIQKIKRKFLVDEDTIKHIVISLVSGKHILLAGPVGTGKTSISKIISEYFWKSDENDGYYSNTFTATSEWTSQDIMGGLMPRMRGQAPSYEIVYGCVSETVINNWSSINHNLRTEIQIDGRKFKGMWLVIDEFNRADIDKVFGQLFTSLESRILKVPSAQEQNGYKEIIIPRDYRIIGTLNTADKHYLFRLSDALKRRFAYIEILPPNSNQKSLEIYYAFKNACDELGNNFDNLIVLDDETKSIDINRTESSFVPFIENAYYVLEFIRTTKPLGTAILKSIYQTMLVGIRLTGDYEKSLDFALTSSIIPQLENLRSSTLEMIVSFLFYDIIEFFKEIHKGNEREQYKEDFRSFLAFISTNKPETKLRDFVSQNVQEDFWNSISNKFSEKRRKISAGLFKKSLKDLIRVSVI